MGAFNREFSLLGLSAPQDGTPEGQIPGPNDANVFSFPFSPSAPGVTMAFDCFEIKCLGLFIGFSSKPRFLREQSQRQTLMC